MGRPILLTAAVLALAGCSAPPVVRQVAFDEAEYAPYGVQGNASVYGQAFLRRDDGSVVTAAGETVYLEPKTAYAEEWLRAVRANRRIEGSDPRLGQFTHNAVADAAGRFEFRNVAAGTYLVSCFLRYGEYRGGYSLDQEGGWMVKEVTVPHLGSVRVILNSTVID